MKALAEVLAFPSRASVVPFPKSQLCGCGCGTLLNKQEDSFIIREETGQWYTDEVDFLKALDVQKSGTRYRFRHDEYWYTQSEFYEEMKAS